MGWIVFWAAVALTGVVGLAANINKLRFKKRISDEARDLLARAEPNAPLDDVAHLALPVPVQRYVRWAIEQPGRAVKSARLKHGGQFRTKLDGPWSRIEGQEYFLTNPPAFLWWGRIHLVPGVWFDVRDSSIDGTGSMHAELESMVTVVDVAGTDLDSGAMSRLLGELVWVPSALLDARYVQWEPVDDRRALATLEVDGGTVACTFEFDAEGAPIRISADRVRDVDGRGVLTPWSVQNSDFRWERGMRVPHRSIVYWHIDGKRTPYADFTLQRIDYDATTPFEG